MDSLNELEKLKKKAEEDILSVGYLSKLEKLELLEEKDIWKHSPFINHVFPEWEEECKQMEREAAIADGKVVGKDYISTIVDDIFDPSTFRHEKYEIVSYLDEMDYLEELLDETDGTDKEGYIRVVTCRGNYNSAVYKTYDEVVEAICDYCLENKIIGYRNDW